MWKDFTYIRLVLLYLLLMLETWRDTSLRNQNMPREMYPNSSNINTHTFSKKYILDHLTHDNIEYGFWDWWTQRRFLTKWRHMFLILKLPQGNLAINQFSRLASLFLMFSLVIIESKLWFCTTHIVEVAQLISQYYLHSRVAIPIWFDLVYMCMCHPNKLTR